MVTAGREPAPIERDAWRLGAIPASGRSFRQLLLVCIDLQPYCTAQAPDRSDILNVAGFSDAAFSVVAGFLADNGGRFVAEIEKVEL
jgi:hypothetical protein